MATALVVCLVSSNLFATKVFALGAGVTLPGAVIVFPISYILNDCICEVWGYTRARLVIWLAFAANFFVVVCGQIVAWLPAADFWQGGDHFNFVFNMAPRVAAASMLAFLAGSTMNALVMSKMKLSGGGRRFGLRAIVSSVAGEALDSLIFIPIAFIGTPAVTMLRMMAFQICFKVLYEIVILPVTSAVVARVKAAEQVDVFDSGISYNPFKIKDIR